MTYEEATHKMIELDKIYNMDCLEGMKMIPDGSVDAVICDLPYGTTDCAWDSVIPFDKLWEQYKRICKPNAAIVLFGSQPFTSLLITSNLKWFREELIWVKNKSASGFSASNRHLKTHENVIVFSQYSNYTYNPIVWNVSEDFIIKRKTMEISDEKNNIAGFTKSGRKRKKDNGTRQPISILPFRVPYSPKSRSKTKSGDYRMHPTQKPFNLLLYLALTYTNEGDTVLDNCMGSGTTAIACIKEKRHFIGFELNKEYYEKEQQQLRLF